MSGKSKRPPIGSGDPPAPPRASRREPDREPAPRKREASRSRDPSEDESPPCSVEADREERDDEEDHEEEKPSGSPTEDFREPADSPPPDFKKQKKDSRSARNEFRHKFTNPRSYGDAMVRQGHRARDKARGRSTRDRNHKRTSGASASSAARQHARGSHGQLVPTPPALPPPPGLQRKVTLQANTGRHYDGDVDQPSPLPPPPPPAGRTPDEHLRAATEFLTSLQELERDAAGVRGTLDAVKEHTTYHIMNLRREFRIWT